MIGIYKYPRTRHLLDSALQPGDEDLARASFDEIAGRHLLIEEKVDGANAAISFDANGRLLLQSTGFDAPKDAGQAIARLQREGLGALAGQRAHVDGVADADVAAALAALAAHAEAAA